jgi:hypothetical protein
VALAALDRVSVMWRALKIAWRIVWGTVELAIVVYVLSAINDRNTGPIVGILGLIYATIRSLFLSVGMAFVHLGTGLDREVYELKRLLRSLWQEPPDLLQFPEELRPPPALKLSWVASTSMPSSHGHSWRHSHQKLREYPWRP